MKKYLIIVFIVLLSLSSLNVSAKTSYNYSPQNEVIESAEALVVKEVVNANNYKNLVLVDKDGTPMYDLDDKLIYFDLAIGELKDIFVFEDKVYLVDSTNNYIIVLDSNFKYINHFPNDKLGNIPTGFGLNKPQGIFVTKDLIYVADQGNNRIVTFNHQYNRRMVIEKPDDPTFEKVDFKPSKIAVDRTGRMYVVDSQLFEGIIDFNPNGTFSRYVGVNTVTLSVWEAFWHRFTSDKQRASQGLKLATSFLNVNINDDYLYTVSRPGFGDVVKKLNYKGQNVLLKNGYVPPIGDILIQNRSDNAPRGASFIVDIDVNDYGNYSVLDKTRGRIFTYDFEGNLLYIGGRLGGQNSMFANPEAIAYFNDSILVVDSMNKNLVVFEYTHFGKLVNEATKLYYEGKTDEARDVWEQVLDLNTNYYLAHAGIGKALLMEGNYQEAMESLKLGYDYYNYSKAYHQYRLDKMTTYFPYIIITVMLGLGYLFVRSIKSSIKREEEED